MLLTREEESARDSEGKNREQQSKKQKAKQTGVTVEKTCNRQRSVEHILMQGEVYLGRGKKQAVSGSNAGSGNGRIETRVGIEVMDICCWKERRSRPVRAKARTGSKAGSGMQSRPG
jgi:hypothetical protein